jgi:hypothetical protein
MDIIRIEDINQKYKIAVSNFVGFTSTVIKNAVPFKLTIK